MKQASKLLTRIPRKTGAFPILQRVRKVFLLRISWFSFLNVYNFPIGLYETQDSFVTESTTLF